MPLSAPQQQGDLLNQADVLGHTMIVAPTEFIEHIQTVNTKPGEKSPAIRVNVADFVDANGQSLAEPVIYRGVLWFGVISGPLRRQVGEFLAGRMSQGAASPGRNAPWQLADVTQDQAWMNHLVNWLDNTEAGQSFQAEAIAEANRAASAPTETTAPPSANAQQAVTGAVVAAPPAAPSVAAPPASPVSAPAAAPVSAPAPAAAPSVAAPAGDPLAALSGLPPEELAKVLAALGQQGQAAH